MRGFFDTDDSHVLTGEGSAGPPVSVWDMVQQGFRQQYRADSQLAWDQELANRWQESLRGLRDAGQNFSAPTGSLMYRRFAESVRNGTPVTEDNFNPLYTRGGVPQPNVEAEEMSRANEAIRQLNNPNIKTFEQILEEVSAMQQDVEQETASMSERGGTSGAVGSLIGAIGGSFTLRDPLNIVTAPIGGGRTAAVRITTDMLIAAGVVTATEYGDVQPNRALAGLPERNPLYNILAATLGAGAIRGGIEGTGAGVRSTDWYQQRQAIRELERMEFDARDTSLRAALETLPESPSARAAVSALDDTIFIERNNPYGEGRAASERFIAELRAVQRSMNGEPMTAVARVLPPMPFEYIQKVADFEIVREQAPLVYARMEQAQARVADLREGNMSFERSEAPNLKEGTNLVRFTRGDIEGELIWRDGDTEAGINIYGEGANTASISELRAGLIDIKNAFPELKTVRGVRMSGSRAEAPQVVRASLERPPSAERRNANAEYQAAFRAVEAEAVRLREKQTRVEAVQQGEASNILAKVSEGRPFVGPLLRYDSIEALVDRINTINDTLDERAVAAFSANMDSLLKRTEGEAGVPPAWLTEDGRVDIGLREPVDPDFRVPTDDGEMSVANVMRDLQDDVDLVDTIRSCAI